MNSVHSTLLFFADQPWFFALVKGSLLLLVTGLLFGCAKCLHLNAVARHALLLAGSVAALAVPLWSLTPAPSWRLAVAASREQRPAPMASPTRDDATEHAAIAPTTAVDGLAPASAGAFRTHPASALAAWTVNLSPARLALWCWLGGVAIVLLPLVVAYARLVYQAARARAVTHPVWIHWLKQETSRLGIRHPVRLCMLREMDLAPATFGFGRWTHIALPGDALAWTESEIRPVLIHELAHVRRRDWLAQLAGQIMRTVYWFNPAAWWAAQRMNCEAEFACDNQVVGSGVRPTAYAECMVRLAGRMSGRAINSGWTMPSMPFVSFLSRRIVMVLETSEDRRKLGRGSVGGLTVAALLMAAAVGGMRITSAADAAATVAVTIAPAAADPDHAAQAQAQTDNPWPQERRIEAGDTEKEQECKATLQYPAEGVSMIATESHKTLDPKDAGLGGYSYGTTVLQVMKGGKELSKKILERDGEAHLLLCDLNRDGHPVVIVATCCAGSGSYLTLRCCAWDGRKLKEIKLPHWPEVAGGDMGHEWAEVVDKGCALTVEIPRYLANDTNAEPRGGKAKYKLSMQRSADGKSQLVWQPVPHEASPADIKPGDSH